MFKLSDDLDSDDDFLEREFTDDFLSSTADPKETCSVDNTPCPRRASSTGVTTMLHSIEPAGRLQKKLRDGNNVTPVNSKCSPNGVKLSTPIAGGFQRKTKTSPVLLKAANTGSSHFETTLAVIPPALQPPSGTRQSSCADEALILHRNSHISSLTVSYSKAPVLSHDLPPASIALDDVENRNSAFLAEWNDDSFFDAPPKKQPVSSPAVRAHTPEVVTRKLNRAVRQRRFPGPAGLLPPRQGNTSLITPEEFLIELKTEDNDRTYQETEILSQSSGSVFEGGAWSAMLEDLGASGHTLLKNMNLASIKAIGRNVRSYKVPFLSVLVQVIDASLPDAAVVFKDPTGEMHGVIHRDVWDQFGSDVAVGTVLVLRNVGIISAGISSRKHVVNITGNNLTAIYSPKDELNIQLRRIHEFAASTSTKLLAEWEKVESQTANSASPVTGRMQPRSAPLRFNGFQAGGCFSGRLAGTPDSRPPIHPRGTSKPRPLAPSFNQRNGLIAQSYDHTGTPKAPAFKQKNGSLASSTCTTRRSTERGLNPRDGPRAGIWNSSDDPMAPNACLNTAVNPPSASSPFLPMPSRPSSWCANRNSPVNANNENSSSAGNQKFSPKAPFTVKAPANARPLPHPPPNIFTSDRISNHHHQLPATPKAPQSCVPSALPIKKPKLCQNAPSSTTSKKNPFQVDSDTSAIDSLLEGIDTDSLFGDF